MKLGACQWVLFINDRYYYKATGGSILMASDSDKWKNMRALGYDTFTFIGK
jgi:hypothetical protein